MLLGKKLEGKKMVYYLLVYLVEYYFRHPSVRFVKKTSFQKILSRHFSLWNRAFHQHNFSY